MAESQQNGSESSTIMEKDLPGLIDDDIEKGEQPQLVMAPLDWDGPDDPDNPLNWPAWKRRIHILPPALISFAA